MKSVLVVDDEFGILEALVDLLRDEGFEVASAQNGKEALQRLSEQRPDFILLDYMMPVMDGPETLRTLQSDPEYRDIPVVMMSAVPQSSLPGNCAPAAFLRKPFDIETLLAQLARLSG